MRQRIKQFIRGVTAKLTAADHAYVKKNLGTAAQGLFYAMDVIDQYHALQVAYTAEKLALGRTDIRGDFLIRLALLHDVGRVKGDMGLWGKVFGVVIYGLSQRLAARFSPLGRLGRILYIYRHHPAIGAAKLSAIGLTEEAVLIEGHHKPLSPPDPPELRLLKQADSLN